MKKIYFAFCVIVLSQSCAPNASENTIENHWLQVKQTSDLRTYEGFLIDNPDTPHLPEILDSIKVFWEIIISDAKHNFCRGHCFTVFMNNEGQLLFDSNILDDQQLVLAIQEALLFPERLGRTSLKDGVAEEAQNLPLPIKGIIDLKGAEKQNPKRYAEVIKLVKLAFEAVRNDYSKEIFQKEFEELSKIESDRIQKLVPLNISFEKYIPPPPPPPSLNLE